MGVDVSSAASAAASDPNALSSYSSEFFQAFDAPSPYVRNGERFWTVGFDRAATPTCGAELDLVASLDGDGIRALRVNQQVPIADPTAFSLAVAAAVSWLDQYLVIAATVGGACPPGVGNGANPLATWCYPRVFHADYGRDPFGAGGWKWQDRDKWFDGYVAFYNGVRLRFPYPGNDIRMGGPSTVERDVSDALSPPLIEFLDRLSATHTPVSFVSVDIVARNPEGATAIVQKIADAAAARGLRNELLGGPVKIDVLNLRLDPTSWPAHTAGSVAARATWLGAYYFAFALDVAESVEWLTLGRAVPQHADCGAGSDQQLQWPTDLTAYDLAGIPDGTPTAASWWMPRMMRAIWELDLSTIVHGSQDGIHALVVAHRCLPVDFTADSVCDLSVATSCREVTRKRYPDLNADAIPADKRREMNILVADTRLPDALIRPIEVSIDVPPDVTDAYVRWAVMDGQSATWTTLGFDHGATVPVRDGKLVVHLKGQSPAMFDAQVFF